VLWNLLTYKLTRLSVFLVWRWNWVWNDWFWL